MTNEHIVEPEDMTEVEEVEENNAEENETVEKGILFYHTAEGRTGYSFVNKDTVTLQDIAFYKRYMDQLEQSIWDNQGGLKHVKDSE